MKSKINPFSICMHDKIKHFEIGVGRDMFWIWSWTICLVLNLSILSAKPFVTADLMGQFGNQMFIMAAASSLAWDNGADPVFPGLAAQEDFNIPTNYEKVFYNLDVSVPEEGIDYVYHERHFYYEPIQYRPNMMIRGWFQSEKYFLSHKDKIMQMFAPGPEIVDYLSRKYGFIVDHPETVGIHYRSYEMEDPGQLVYVDCDVEYYKKAVSLFPKDFFFIVFSNDPEKAKKIFGNISGRFFYVQGETHYHDFYLMSLCKHQIICNSSFSWWAAYLNPNPQKGVVAPLRWFNPNYGADDRDLVPEGWLRL